MSDDKTQSVNGKDLNEINSVANRSKSANGIKPNSSKNVIKSSDDGNVEKKSFLTDEMKKHVSILFILLFLLMFFLSSAAFVIITFTNIFNKSIVENLVLRNGTKSLEWWIDSPLKPLIKVHIFNYTNIDAVLKGEESKIKVEDIGPYVYEEHLKRVNLTFLDEHKITFYEDRMQTFSRKLTPSDLSEDDKVYVPNLPLILAINKVNDDGAKTFGLKTIIATTQPKEFQTRTVKEVLFGYVDSFVNGISLAMTDFRPEKLGILGARKGISTDNLTIYTGEDSLDMLAKVYAMNDETKMNYWHTDECNEIKGTDGSQFSLSEVSEEENLQIFVKSLCRPYPMTYDKEVTVLNGLPAKRYRPLKNIFGSSIVNEENKCYCDSDIEKCPPSGVFDAEKCVDAKLLMSYPHFYEGDEILLEHFDGLSPSEEKHETYADIHPRMAFPIGGASRMQINVRVKKISIMSGLFSTKTLFNKLPDELILPICWIEVTAGHIPPELMAIVFNTTHSANATYLTIQYGSIICMFFSFLLVLSTSYLYFKRLGGGSDDKLKSKDVVFVNKL